MTNWEWIAKDGKICGVVLSSDELLWWSRPTGIHGYFSECASKQPISDFISNGPQQGIPTELFAELEAEIKRRY